jgi:hypothetical protein
MMIELWLFVAYLAGSVTTYWLCRKTIALNSVESTIDQLVDQGFLRSKKDSSGETEILKWNDNKGFGE